MEKQLGPLTLAQFIAFVASKPTDGQYYYCSNEQCPIAQLFSAHGYIDVHVADDVDCTKEGAVFKFEIDPKWEEAVNPENNEMTWGGLLTRLQQL